MTLPTFRRDPRALLPDRHRPPRAPRPATRRPVRRRHPVRAVRAAERPDAPRPRGPQGPDRRGQRLVPRRLEERAAGPHRLRPPVRAPDVQRERALQQGLLPGPARARRRHRPERHHQRGPHQLLPERARPPRSTSCSGSSPTGWATCSAPSPRRKLDEQRGVVQNEKRQGENEPYGKVWDFLTPRLVSRRTTPTPGPSSARWRTSTPPRWTT